MQATRRSEFIAGMRDTFPLVVGAIPFGVIFGALAVTSGISPAGALGMSLLVFAGSAQFIAASLVAQGAGLAIIIFTTLIVNLRHALYSATLAPRLKGLSQKWLLPLGFWLTDETFVVVARRYNQTDDSPYKHWYHLGSSVIMYLNWNLCTLLGVIAGQTVSELRQWGLDFALYVTFIGMLVSMIKDRALLLAALAAGVSAVLLQGLPNQLWIIVSAIIGIIAGIAAESLPKPEAKPDVP